ncbi:MAG: pyridoxal phosphate-dependent aminotransferase [Chloroflexota bacterium]
MLAPYAVAAARRGVHVYHLNIGQPDFDTPPALREAIRTFAEPTISYAPSQGLPAVLTAWSRYYRAWGMALDESEMIVTVGGSEAIILAMMCVADPGDEIIVFDPSYTNYCGFAAAAAINLVPIVLQPAQAFHLPPAQAIAAAVTERTRAILVCNPNNPTGSVYTPDELRGVLRVAEDHGLFVIADEVYRELVFDAHTYTGLLTLPGAAPRTILVDSVSKRFNACGVRIGCLATHNPDVIRVALHLAQARLSAPTVEQLAVVPLLEDAISYTRPLAMAYQRRRDAAVAALSAIPGVRFTTPEGAFYMILELPVDDAETFARWLLEEFAYEGETVMLAPLRGFYVTPGHGARAVRLAFVLAEEPLARAVEVLGHALAAYPGRTDDTGGGPTE